MKKMFLLLCLISATFFGLQRVVIASSPNLEKLPPMFKLTSVITIEKGYYKYQKSDEDSVIYIHFDSSNVVFNIHVKNAVQYVKMEKIGGKMKIVQALRSIWDEASLPVVDNRPTPILRTNDLLFLSSSPTGYELPTVDEALKQIGNVDPIVTEALKAYREQIPNYSQKNEGEYGEWLETVGTIPEKDFPFSMWEKMSDGQKILSMQILFGISVGIGVGAVVVGSMLLCRRKS